MADIDFKATEMLVNEKLSYCGSVDFGGNVSELESKADRVSRCFRRTQPV